MPVRAIPDPDTVMWWCTQYQVGSKDEGLFDDGTCSICGSSPANHGCGWVPRPDKPLEVVSS